MSKGQQNATLARQAPASPLEKWKADLFKEGNVANLARALSGTGTDPSRFAWQAYGLIQRTPKLLEAPSMQLWMGIFGAAECGLSLHAQMQQYHLVPFGREVTPIIGYQGFAYLTMKAGGGIIDPPVIVWQRDVEEGRFRYREGTNRTCRLDPVVKDPRKPKGEVRFVFVTYTAANGVRTFKCLDREFLLERRERSSGWQAFKSGRRKKSPWNIEYAPDGTEAGDWPAMCEKTAIRVIAKTVPKSADHWGERAAKADAVEGAVDAGEDLSGVLDATVGMEAEETGTERVKRNLGVSPEDAHFTDYQPPEPPEDMVLPGQKEPKR